MSISSNLPDETAYVILEDPGNENILYAGLYRGVYVSVDRGKSWSLLGPEMAATAISDLVIQEREMDLVVGTHGRGIYKMNIIPIQRAFENGIPNSPFIFETPVARRPWINESHRDFRVSTAEKIPITFYLTQEAEVTINVINTEEAVVWSHKLNAGKGFNQIRWDLITKKVDSPEAYFFRYIEYVRPGSYEIRVIGQGVDLKSPLTVIDRQSPDYKSPKE